MNPAERDFSPLTPSIVRALNDKLYEKRKVAALEIEKSVCRGGDGHGQVSGSKQTKKGKGFERP